MIGRAVARLILVPLGVVLAATVGALVIASLGLERLTQELHRTGDLTGVGGAAWGIFRHWGTIGKLVSALTIIPTVLLIVGLLRVFYFEKGAAYYWSSHAFLTKFAVFILVAVLSAVPTIEFLSWRKAVRAGQAPTVSDKKLKTVRSILHYELIGIVVILACAALMAKGGWV